MGVRDWPSPFIALAAAVEIHRGFFNTIALLANLRKDQQN
jgi:hypothetical protein